MNTSAEPKTVLNREDIAAHAHQLWQHEGCQTGRDQEYWLKPHDTHDADVTTDGQWHPQILIINNIIKRNTE